MTTVYCPCWLQGMESADQVSPSVVTITLDNEPDLVPRLTGNGITFTMDPCMPDFQGWSKGKILLACVYSLFNRMMHADTDPQG